MHEQNINNIWYNNCFCAVCLFCLKLQQNTPVRAGVHKIPIQHIAVTPKTSQNDKLVQRINGTIPNH